MSICRVDRPCMRGVQHWESEIERAMWQRGSDTVSPRQVPIIPQGSLLGNTGCLAGQLPCAEVWTQFSRLSSVTCRIKVLNTRAAALWTLFLLMGFLTPRQPHWVSLVAQTVQKSACNTGDLGSIPGSGEHPGEGKGNPLQDCGLVNSTDRGAWWATVHVVRKSGTWLHLPQVASLPFGDTLRAFYLPWWLEATRAFLLDSSSVSFEGRHLLSLDLLQVLQGLLVFILDLSSPGKHSLHPSKKSRTAEPPEDLL